MLPSRMTWPAKMPGSGQDWSEWADPPRLSSWGPLLPRSLCIGPGALKLRGSSAGVQFYIYFVFRLLPFDHRQDKPTAISYLQCAIIPRYVLSPCHLALLTVGSASIHAATSVGSRPNGARITH